MHFPGHRCIGKQILSPLRDPGLGTRSLSTRLKGSLSDVQDNRKARTQQIVEKAIRKEEDFSRGGRSVSP